MLTPLLNNQREVVDAGPVGPVIPEVRATEILQEVEHQGITTKVTEVIQEIEWQAPEVRTTESLQEVESEHFPDVVATSDFQAVEYERDDVVVTELFQAVELLRPDVIVTSVMQIVEYIDQPPPPPPPGEQVCPPFRIYWQDSNVRAHAWKDGSAQAYNTIRPFGGHHQADGAKI